MTIRLFRSPLVACLLVALMAFPNELLLRAQSQAAKPAAAPATPPAGTNADTGWPRTVQLDSGSFVWFQPQIESWEDRKSIVGWSAAAYTPLTATEATLGTIKIEGTTKVSVDERVVSLDLKVTQVNFPSLSSVQIRSMVTEIEALPV